MLAVLDGLGAILGFGLILIVFFQLVAEILIKLFKNFCANALAPREVIQTSLIMKNRIT